MRLRTECPPAARAWTVELRCQTGELVLVCRQCPHSGRQVTAESARSAALAHLARHARGDLRALHLRTCQCHERGCRWHRRHRGCAGSIRLLLACERGGRVWRLADACSACAVATTQASVVPDTVLVELPCPPSARPHRARRSRGPGERVRVSEMLSYLAVALPADASPEARVLALQCALRMNASMRVQLPAGLLRSLGIDAAQVSRELERAGWLSVMDSPRAAGIAAQLLDATLLAQAPARPDRRRAADWALRNGCPARAGAADPGLQLLGVYLTVHGDPSSGNGSRECDWIKRDCGMPDQALPGALDQLKGSGVLKGWRICPDSGDMHWILASEQE
ncbi:conserved hypothetical protein [Streptomyces himastatinicus ATCC 53653]|uniref:Uncharacterized protein n=1 Tax=Streptomyces himastatinicus ATCC 53653 TaxID=457427 RepID=D9WBK6_9ACTN|nr:conserved hypothetical protein [Streptomyces himastatinicus ATCC 53653]